MPRWPAGHKKRTDRNYAKETAFEQQPEQKMRKAQRTKARYDAEKKGIVKKGDGKEMDHQGFHPHGSLKNVPVKAVSRKVNRSRQPPHKGKK